MYPPCAGLADDITMIEQKQLVKILPRKNVTMFFGNGKVRPNARIQLLQDFEENPNGSYEFIVAA